jgi:chaperonin GroES
MKKKKTPMHSKKSVKKVASHSVHTSPLTPLSDKVIVKPLTAEEMGITTSFGIIIPDNGKEKPEQGTVVAVGPGKWNEDGDARIPVSVAVGARIMFSKYGFDEVKIEGVTYYVIAESNILAIIKG